MKTAIIIPARYASSRLPGKPLLRETGKYLIQHAYDQAKQSSADLVVVATDDRRVEKAVREFGGQVMMTSSGHQSGTDRVAEVARKLPVDIVINLQGDEPLVAPKNLDFVAKLLTTSQDQIATLAVPVENLEEWHNPNCVKVVIDDQGRALYFSRSPIPYCRDEAPTFGEAGPLLKHLGLYAYRREFLLRLTNSPPSPLERLEQLEQLRVLSLGGDIRVGIVRETFGGVDTPEDYHRFVQVYQRLTTARAA